MAKKAAVDSSPNGDHKVEQLEPAAAGADEAPLKGHVPGAPWVHRACAVCSTLHLCTRGGWQAPWQAPVPGIEQVQHPQQRPAWHWKEPLTAAH